MMNMERIIAFICMQQALSMYIQFGKCFIKLFIRNPKITTMVQS